jgi:hypothetical protein
MDHEAFFRDHEDYVVVAKYYGSERTFTVEQLYQAFAARLQREQNPEEPHRTVPNV